MTYTMKTARRGLAALAVGLVSAVAAAGPASAMVTWDPNCSSGCELAQVKDGTSNTLAIAEAAHIDLANHRAVVTLRPGQHLAQTRLAELRLSSPYYVITVEDIVVSLTSGPTESLSLNFTKITY